MRVLLLSLLCALASAAEKGQWVITSDPPGAMISIDGTQVGRAPFVLKNLLPGEHLVEATWPDGRTSSSTERVVAGGSRVLKLLPRAAPLPPPPEPSPEPIAQEPAPTPSPEAEPPAPSPAPVAAPPVAAPPVAAPPIYTPPTIVIVPAAPPPAPKPSIAEVKNDQPAAAKPKKFYKSALFWSSIVIAVGAIVTVGVGAGIAANQPNRYAIAKF